MKPLIREFSFQNFANSEVTIHSLNTLIIFHSTVDEYRYKLYRNVKSLSTVFDVKYLYKLEIKGIFIVGLHLVS